MKKAPSTTFARALALTLAGALCGALSACQTPAPYDPVADCPREAYCGQCASHGACVWCGDPSDGAKGQCVAIGRTECSAPQAFAKTPDRCAPPPPHVPYVRPTAENASPVAKALGPEKYNAIHAALTRAFPGSNVNDEVVSGVAEVITSKQATPPIGEPTSRERAPITRRVEEKEHPLYLGFADHHRVRSPAPEGRAMKSRFVLELPMVRVPVPEKLTAENTTIATVIGDVELSRDHLLGSIDLIAAKYGSADYLGARPARVDLITPPRSLGWRFGAIAVYLGYRNAADKAPWFYMLEAGTATGDAKMIYFSPSMKRIENATSYYLPTPFVTMHNTYSGGITMRSPPHEDEPLTLLVESRSPGDEDPYITVTVTYQRAAFIDLPMPVELTADAGARVALIAKTMGIPSQEPLEDTLADLARTFAWLELPRYTPVAVPPAPSATPVSPPPTAPAATPGATAGPAATTATP